MLPDRGVCCPLQEEDPHAILIDGGSKLGVKRQPGCIAQNLFARLSNMDREADKAGPTASGLLVLVVVE